MVLPVTGRPLLSVEKREAGNGLPVSLPSGGMPTLERLLRVVGGVAVVAGVAVFGYGFLAPEMDVVAMLAGVFTAVVGLTLVAAGLVLPRVEEPDTDSRRA